MTCCSACIYIHSLNCYFPVRNDNGIDVEIIKSLSFLTGFLTFMLLLFIFLFYPIDKLSHSLSKDGTTDPKCYISFL